MDTTSQLTQDFLLAEEAMPRGFRFAATRAGLKQSGKPDFACAVAESGCTAAAMFTSNQVVAAPLTVGRRNLEQGQHRIHVMVVNAGNANCATGEAGIQAAQRICDLAGEIFGCDSHAVFPSSTGIIGVPLPVEKLITALPNLQEDLGSAAADLEAVARAIMTTDTRPKVAAASFAAGERSVRMVGIAKGAGMIYPRLTGTAAPVAPHATMLSYIFTDAEMDFATADTLLHHAVEKSFNRISIDGDTSTNDTVLLLANGESGVTIDKGNSEAFASALRQVCESLAKQIVSDGEGVEHVVELDIRGALSDSDALQVARSIAHSPLVKTSWAGRDPNWGRILAAVGYSGVTLNPALINIYLGDLEICRGGSFSPEFDKEAAHRYLHERELSIRVDLGLGAGACRFWTVDLTTEYVHINADYST